jgi:hypothetical protein
MTVPIGRMNVSVGVFLNPFADIPGQVEPGMHRVFFLDHLDDAKALDIVVESAVVFQEAVQLLLAGVPAGRMPEVMGQGDRLRQSSLRRRARAMVRLIEATSIVCVSRVR